jgi:hypothetical protein
MLLMQHPETRPEKSGFALREVLVGILMFGIALVFVQAQLQGMQATKGGAFCQSNARQVGIALFMYAADYDGKLPANAGSFAGLVHSTQPYLRDDSRFHCPENSDAASQGRASFRVPALYAGRPIAGGWPDPYVKGQAAQPDHTILLYESAKDTNTAITPSYRHSGGAVCLMFTGQSAWVPNLSSTR